MSYLTRFFGSLLCNVMPSSLSPTRFTTDTDNATWLEVLRSDGIRRNQAILDLRKLLIRGLRAALRPRVDHQADALAEDVAQDALLRILDKLDTFRGESRFTTWAQKIAVRMAFDKLRRKRWENVHVSDVTERDGPLPSSFVDGQIPPDQQTALQMNVQQVRDAIANDLTERQRTAMQAVVLEGMPLSEVARDMDSTRNAMYKLMYDARKRLKRSLQRRGINPNDLLDEPASLS